MRQQREAELSASQITLAHADAEQNVIQQEAEGRAQATRIRAIAEAEADAIRRKAAALLEAGGMYLDLRRIELAPELTQRGCRGAGQRSVRQLRHERRRGRGAMRGAVSPAPRTCCAWCRL